jgi:hypothetical protein
MVELAAVNRPVVGSSPTEPVLESWQSGLMQRFTKPPKRNLPGVRIPQIPSEADAELRNIGVVQR